MRAHTPAAVYACPPREKNYGQSQPRGGHREGHLMDANSRAKSRCCYTLCATRAINPIILVASRGSRKPDSQWQLALASQ